MWKILSAAVSGLALGSISLSPAFSQPTSDDEPAMGMIGGNCPTLLMMGRPLLGMTGRDGDMGPMRGQHMGPGMMRGREMGMGMGRMLRQARIGAVVEARLAYLRFEIGITNEQNDAWKAYTDAVRARVASMQGMHQALTETMRSGTAVERMDARIKAIEGMLASLNEVKPATEKLYAVLTDPQKEVADELIGKACGAL